jgi:type IV pilus assembly protein PilA
VNKLKKKFLNSFRAGESGFTLIELLIVIAILGILAAVIIPNVSRFIGTSHVAAANSELAQIETAGQAAAGAATAGTLTAGFIDPAILKADTTATAQAMVPFITGKIQGGYYINSDGSVMLVASPAKQVASSTQNGDPSYLNLYYDETSNQFVATAAGVGSVPAGDSVTAQCTAQP